jgi:hypothetical protein
VVGFASAEQIVVEESVGYVPIAVRARGTLRGPVHLAVVLQKGAARPGEDFVVPVERVTLEPRRPTAEILVAVVTDAVRENVEDFGVALTLVDGEAEMGASHVSVVLTDDD